MYILSYPASVTLENVLDELQNADELGGCENVNDYINLMNAVISECNARITTSINLKESEA